MFVVDATDEVVFPDAALCVCLCVVAFAAGVGDIVVVVIVVVVAVVAVFIVAVVITAVVIVAVMDVSVIAAAEAVFIVGLEDFAGVMSHFGLLTQIDVVIHIVVVTDI